MQLAPVSSSDAAKSVARSLEGPVNPQHLCSMLTTQKATLVHGQRGYVLGIHCSRDDSDCLLWLSALLRRTYTYRQDGGAVQHRISSAGPLDVRHVRELSCHCSSIVRGSNVDSYSLRR